MTQRYTNTNINKYTDKHTKYCQTLTHELKLTHVLSHELTRTRALKHTNAHTLLHTHEDKSVVHTQKSRAAQLTNTNKIRRKKRHKKLRREIEATRNIFDVWGRTICCMHHARARRRRSFNKCLTFLTLAKAPPTSIPSPRPSLRCYKKKKTTHPTSSTE